MNASSHSLWLPILCAVLLAVLALPWGCSGSDENDDENATPPRQNRDWVMPQNDAPEGSGMPARHLEPGQRFGGAFEAIDTLEAFQEAYAADGSRPERAVELLVWAMHTYTQNAQLGTEMLTVVLDPELLIGGVSATNVLPNAATMARVERLHERPYMPAGYLGGMPENDYAVEGPFRLVYTAPIPTPPGARLTVRIQSTGRDSDSPVVLVLRGESWKVEDFQDLTVAPRPPASAGEPEMPNAYFRGDPFTPPASLEELQAAYAEASADNPARVVELALVALWQYELNPAEGMVWMTVVLTPNDFLAENADSPTGFSVNQITQQGSLMQLRNNPAIVRSYLGGTPENGYAVPEQCQVLFGGQPMVSEGMATVLVQSSGKSSASPVTLRRMQGVWKVSGISSLMTGVREAE